MNREDLIASELEGLSSTVDAARTLVPAITRTGGLIVECLHGGGKLLSCGNGGSATDALHLAEELVGRYKGERPSLPAICLAADISAMTCIGNDYGFDKVFSRSVESLGQPGDILVGFSTSGNSPNVLEAFKAARRKSVTTILVSGKYGGSIREFADHALIVPSDSTARIQELHTFILHAWLECVELEDWSGCDLAQ